MKEAHPASARSLLLSALILSSSAFQAQAYYHPEEGRWISRDPIGEKGFDPAFPSDIRAGLKPDLNLYEFAGNEPLNSVDPFGDAYGNPVPPVVISPPLPTSGTPPAGHCRIEVCCRSVAVFQGHIV